MEKRKDFSDKKRKKLVKENNEWKIGENSEKKRLW